MTSEQNWWDKLKPFVEIAGVVILAVYTWYTIKMYHANKKAADAAKQSADIAKSALEEITQGSTDTHDLAVAAKKQAVNTEILANAAKDQVAKLQAGVKESHALAKATQDILHEQRPYMWVTPQSPILEEGKLLSWNILFKNYGGSPAIHVSTCAVLSYGPNALALINPSYLSQCQMEPEGSLRSSSISPPGFETFTTLLGKDPLNTDSVRLLRDQSGTLVVIGRITYEDATGKSYVSTFCSVRLDGGGIASCGKYNEIE